MSGERGKGDNVESDDRSDEEEEGAEDDTDEEMEEGGDGDEEESEEEEGEEEDGTENHNAAKDVVTERNVMEDIENEHDAEKQGDDRQDGEHEEDQAKEADKRKDSGDQGEQDGEKDAQDEEEREKEAEREQEAGTSGDMVEKPSEKKAKDDADKDEQADGNEDDEEAEEEGIGTHDEVREDREAIEQRVTANNRDRAWRDCRLADMTDKERKERGTGSGEEERMAGEENGDHEERRKRPSETCDFECLTPRDRPNKRSKSDDSEREDNAASDDLPERTVNLETTPRPKTPSPASTAASPSSILEIVRQTSIVPGLENTRKAVWDAAQSDSTINSLSDQQQTKLIHAALSLGSGEGTIELRRFVHNARKDGMRGSESLESEFNLSAPHSGLDVWHAASSLVPRDSGLALFSNLYRQIDVLDNKATLFSITKRVKLAAMAQYRKGLLHDGAGKNQARDVNLYLFRATYPDHATIERPDDKAKNPAAHNDWIRLRDRLREGRLWLEVRDLFGGVGAFLALPPQCVPDRHVVKMQAKTFESWLRLLDVAWRALDAHARLTLNDLVRMSLAGQPLPEGDLMLEMSDDSTGTAPTSLSGMFTGWPVFDRNSTEEKGGLTATLTQREDGDAAILGTPLITASTTRAEEAGDGGLVSQEGMMGNLEDGLFNGLKDRDFDECLN